MVCLGMILIWREDVNMVLGGCWCLRTINMELMERYSETREITIAVSMNHYLFYIVWIIENDSSLRLTNATMKHYIINADPSHELFPQTNHIISRFHPPSSTSTYNITRTPSRPYKTSLEKNCLFFHVYERFLFTSIKKINSSHLLEGKKIELVFK